ncbi:hypothetical protein V8F20_012192 [Naviculisporaceae sp. PSN 640]
MSKRTTYTTITPLPPGISRQTVLSFLHDHKQIIDLNPLIKERHIIRPPSHAAPDELHCVWYSLTDHVSYLPGRAATGEVIYTCAFNNLPNGVQTHCYAPAGLDIRERWTVNGSLSGEPRQAVEPGLKDAPSTGLYIREDVDMTCNIIMISFVKKTLKDSHAELIERLKLRAQVANGRQSTNTAIYPHAIAPMDTTTTAISTTDSCISNTSTIGPGITKPTSTSTTKTTPTRRAASTSVSPKKAKAKAHNPSHPRTIAYSPHHNAHTPDLSIP